MDVDSKAPVWKFTDWSDEMSTIASGGKLSLKSLEKEEAPISKRQEPVEKAVVLAPQKRTDTKPVEKSPTTSLLESEEKTLYSVVEARTTSLDKWDTRMEMCLVCNSSAAHVTLDERGEMTYSDQYVVICHDCGECYHTYCLTPPIADKSMIKPKVEKWRCPHCKFCILCNQAHNESQLVVCDRCDRCFHSYCANLSQEEVDGDEWCCRECSTCANCQTPFLTSPTSLPPQRRYALCASCNQLYDSRIQPMAEHIRSQISLATAESSPSANAQLNSSQPPVKRQFQPPSEAQASSSHTVNTSTATNAPSKPNKTSKASKTKPSQKLAAALPTPPVAPSNTIPMPSTLPMVVPQAQTRPPQAGNGSMNPLAPAPFSWDSQRNPVRFSEEPHLQHHSLPPPDFGMPGQSQLIPHQTAEGPEQRDPWVYQNPNGFPQQVPQGLPQPHQHQQGISHHHQHPPLPHQLSALTPSRQSHPQYGMPHGPTHDHQTMEFTLHHKDPSSYPPQNLDGRNFGVRDNLLPPGTSAHFQHQHEQQRQLLLQQQHQIQQPHQQSPGWNPTPASVPNHQSMLPPLQPIIPTNGHVLLRASQPAMPFLIPNEVIVVAVSSGGGNNFPCPTGDWRQIFELSAASYQAICNFFRGLEALYSHVPAFFIPAGQFPILEECPNSEMIMGILLRGATPTTIPPYVLPSSTTVPPGTVLLPPREMVQKSKQQQQQPTGQSPQYGFLPNAPTVRPDRLPLPFAKPSSVPNSNIPQFTPSHHPGQQMPPYQPSSSYASGSLTPRSLPGLGGAPTPVGNTGVAAGAPPIPAGGAAPAPHLPTALQHHQHHHHHTQHMPPLALPTSSVPLQGHPPSLVAHGHLTGSSRQVPSHQHHHHHHHQPFHAMQAPSAPLPQTPAANPGLPSFNSRSSSAPIMGPTATTSAIPSPVVLTSSNPSPDSVSSPTHKSRKASTPASSVASPRTTHGALPLVPHSEVEASSASASSSPAQTEKSAAPVKREKRKRDQLSSHAKELQAKLKVLLYGPAYMFILHATDWNPKSESALAKIRTEVNYPYVGYVEPEFPKTKPRVPITQSTYSMFDVRQATMTMFPTTPLYNDKMRNCVLCSTAGDHPILGRLLPLQLADSWIHSGCAIWSTDVKESDDGELKQLYHAIRKSKTSNCAKCTNRGASVACPVARCTRRFHLPCAIQSPCRFINARGGQPRYILCPDHAAKFESVVWTGRLYDEGAIGVEARSPTGIGEYDMSDFDTHRKLHISETDLRQRIAKKEANLDLNTWTSYSFRSGALIVSQIGSITARQAFHSKDNIFTNGYRALRRYWSWKQPQGTVQGFPYATAAPNPFSCYPARTTYEISISEVDSRIHFTIIATDDPQNPVEANDMASAWNEVVNRVNASRAHWNSRSSSESQSPYSPSYSSSKTEGTDDSAHSSVNQSTTQPMNGEVVHHSQFGPSGVNNLPFTSSGETATSAHSSGPIAINIPVGFFFGYESPHLTSHMERLPGAMQLYQYRRKFDMVIRLPSVLTLAVTRYWDPEKSPVLFDAPQNESGAARCQPYVRLSSFERFKQIDAFPCHPAAGLMSFKDLARTRAKFGQALYPQADNSVRGAINVHNMNSYSILTRFRLMKASENIRLKVLRSKIQGRGLFVMEDVCDGEFLIEYVGEVISHRLADEREKRYQSQGIGCYMFSVSNDFVIDATEKGNHSRFINHSCEPNCQIQIEKIDGSPRIVIFAKHAIRQGEELTYDYCFEPEEEKLPCHCGTASCRGFMN